MSDNNLPVQFDQSAIMESFLNPLGSLNLSAEETKLLFFRHLGAEYAQSAKRGRVPYASQLVKAGTAFGGLAGGADPMMMMMMMNMFNQQKPKQEVEVKADVESVLVTILDRLDQIEAKVGAGA